jgi:hypothetical protein
MIIRLAILGIVIGIAWFYMARVKKMPDVERKSFVKRVLLWGFAGFVCVMVIAGRAHWFLAPVAVILPLLQRGAGLVRYLPRLLRFLPMVQAALKMFYGPAAAGESQTDQQGGYRGDRRTPSGPSMSRQEAAEILGVGINDSEEDVIEAHRRLIQRVHPDRGGSDALAAQINDAKRILLGK